MGNCLRKKKQKKKQKTNQELREEPSNEEILQKEIESFYDLELYDISSKFIEKYGIELIKKKLYQQYFWILNNNEDNPDLYIPLEDWELRYILE